MLSAILFRQPLVSFIKVPGSRIQHDLSSLVIGCLPYCFSSSNANIWILLHNIGSLQIVKKKMSGPLHLTVTKTHSPIEEFPAVAQESGLQTHLSEGHVALCAPLAELSYRTVHLRTAS